MAANESDVDGGRWVATRVGPTGFRAETTARTHAFTIDEPVAVGGTDAGPTPYEYLLGALSGCMAMTLRIYADRKGWPLENVEVRLRTARSHEPDCENCETGAVGITKIEREIDFAGPLSDEQRKRLLQIADKCPVKQTLERGIAVQPVANIAPPQPGPAPTVNELPLA
ncbi:MAG: OsmC family protein [Gemmatimonadota bacterium]